MSSEWEDVRLKDITSKLGDGLHGTPDYDDNGTHYFINGNNLNNGEIVINSNTRRTSIIEYQKYKKELNDRTLLVSINGTLGNVALYKGEKVILGKSACYFNVREEVDKQFVRYVLTSELFQNYINKLATGSTIKNVSLKLMRDFAFKLPPLSLQQKISSILQSLDDRIALLRETNATLEAIAQVLFKSWFVDFDPVRAKQEGREPEGMDADTAALFPDSFEESALGLVPRGWRVQPIGDVVQVLGGGTPNTKEPAYWEPQEYHWVTPKDLSGIPAPILLNTERKLSSQGLAKVSSGLLPVNTVLMSSRAPIGYLVITKIPTAINQGFIAIPPNEALSPEFLLLWCRENMDSIKQRANGSTFMEISKSAFRPIPIVKPTIDVVVAFSQITSPIFNRVAQNERQAKTLVTLRDTLLPRLISGQLRLPEAEAMLEEPAA